MVFLNFASRARFKWLILHFIARLSIHKCWNVIFETQSKMPARNDEENFKISHFLANILEAHVLACKKTPTIGVTWSTDNP